MYTTAKHARVLHVHVLFDNYDADRGRGWARISGTGSTGAARKFTFNDRKDGPYSSATVVFQCRSSSHAGPKAVASHRHLHTGLI